MFLEPFPVIFDFFDVDLYVVYIFIELLKVQDRSLLVRTSLRLRYSKVWTNILSLYLAHLADHAFLEKSFDFSVKY